MKPSDESGRGKERSTDRLQRLAQAYQSFAESPQPEVVPAPAEQPMERLFQISRAMMRIHGRDELLEFVSDHLREFFDAQNSFVILFDEAGVPRVQVAHQLEGHESAWPVSSTLIERVRSSRAPIVIQNTADDPDLRDKQSIEMLKIASVLCTPMVIDDDVIGVLQFDHRGESHSFPACDERLLSLFADQVATAFKNLELIEQLAESVEETKAAQARVVQAERLAALGEMAGGIAHDFNNTLFIALGLCEVALAKRGVDDKTRQSLVRIQTCASDAAQTVKRLQIFARGLPEDTDREAVCLSSLAAESQDWTRRKWQEEATSQGSEIEFRTVLGETGYSLAQPSELREILHNLIFNAVEAMADGGMLTVTSGRLGSGSDAFSFIEVRDEGAGMDEATLKRVFEPFFTTKGPRGHGLGLSTCWTIAGQLGGRIEVESELGRGSAFTLLLPTLEKLPEVPVKVEMSVRPGARVLIVDDDSEVLDTIGSLAEAAGMESVMVNAGAEALERLAASSFDAVVTDYVMPVMDGLQLAQRIGSEHPGIPVLVLTGQGAHLSREELSATGCQSIGVVGKPVRSGELSAILARLMGAEQPS